MHRGQALGLTLYNTDDSQKERRGWAFRRSFSANHPFPHPRMCGTGNTTRLSRVRMSYPQQPDRATERKEYLPLFYRTADDDTVHEREVSRP